jgi:hypothetical protein
VSIFKIFPPKPHLHEPRSQGWQKPVFFKKAQPSGFLGFIGFFWFYWGFLNFRPIKSIFLPVFVLFIYLLADEFKIK